MRKALGDYYRVLRTLLLAASGLAGCSLLLTCESVTCATTLSANITDPEPVCRPGTDAVLWSDTFDGYTSVAAMTSGTVPNFTSAGNVLLSSGRGGTGKALRADYSLAPVIPGGGGQNLRSVNLLTPWNCVFLTSTREAGPGGPRCSGRRHRGAQAVAFFARGSAARRSWI